MKRFYLIITVFIALVVVLAVQVIYNCQMVVLKPELPIGYKTQENPLASTTEPHVPSKHKKNTFLVTKQNSKNKNFQKIHHRPPTKRKKKINLFVAKPKKKTSLNPPPYDTCSNPNKYPITGKNRRILQILLRKMKTVKMSTNNETQQCA